MGQTIAFCRLPGRRISGLSSEERLDLLEELWESLSARPEAIPVTEAQHSELNRRLDEIEGERPTGIPWDEVLRQILNRTS